MPPAGPGRISPLGSYRPLRRIPLRLVGFSPEREIEPRRSGPRLRRSSNVARISNPSAKLHSTYPDETAPRTQRRPCGVARRGEDQIQSSRGFLPPRIRDNRKNSGSRGTTTHRQVSRASIGAAISQTRRSVSFQKNKTFNACVRCGGSAELDGCPFRSDTQGSRLKRIDSIHR